MLKLFTISVCGLAAMASGFYCSTIHGQSKPHALYVVSKGVYDSKEFRKHPDRFARKFYDDLGISHVSVLGTPLDGLVHISYRRGNKFFWTSKRRYMPPDTALSTNLQFWIRKRCGNVLSYQPMSPVEADSDQPSDEELGTEGVEPEFDKPTVKVPNIILAIYQPRGR